MRKKVSPVSSEDRDLIVSFLLEDADFSCVEGCKSAIGQVIEHKEWQSAFLRIVRARDCTVREAIMLALAALAHYSCDYYSNFTGDLYRFALEKLQDEDVHQESQLSIEFLVEIAKRFVGRTHGGELSELAEEKLCEFITARKSAAEV